MLHLFREAWLQKFVDFGSDVGLMKFGDVIRLIDRDQKELTDGELLRIMESSWTLPTRLPGCSARMDETFQTRTLELLGLEKHGDEELLASQMQSSGLCARWDQSMRERLQSKTRGASRPAAATSHSGS